MFNNTPKTALLGALLVSSASIANAGGLDRTGNPISFLFSEGEYAELAFAHVMPSVTSALVADSANTSYNQVTLAYKTELNDKVDLGFAIYNPLGADTLYSGTIGPAAALEGVEARLNTTAMAISARYKINDAFSVLGGFRHITASGALQGPGGAPLLVFASGGGSGFYAGVAFERKEIAMRIALTYEQSIGFTLPTTAEIAPDTFVAAPSSVGGAPEAINLEFQTGIAADTLLFGSIRHAKWSGANVFVPATGLPDGGQLTDYDDVTSYSVGVGRRINDKLSLSLSASYEAASGDATVGRLSPSDGRKALALGARYTLDNGTTVSGGVSYTKLGDATTEDGVPFTDNKTLAVGIRIGKTF